MRVHRFPASGCVFDRSRRRRPSRGHRRRSAICLFEWGLHATLGRFMSKYTKFVAAVALASTAVVAQVSTWSLQVGGAGTANCSGAQIPNGGGNGTQTTASMLFSYDKSVSQLTVVVNNTSPVVASYAASQITAVRFNAPRPAPRRHGNDAPLVDLCIRRLCQYMDLHVRRGRHLWQHPESLQAQLLWRFQRWLEQPQWQLASHCEFGSPRLQRGRRLR